MEKIFLRVIVDHAPDGTLRPLSFRWPDGRVFSVDRVLDVRQAPALKVGGLAIRFHCRAHGKELYLFHDEDGRWFWEPVTPADRPLQQGQGW